MRRSLTAGIALFTLVALAVATPKALADPGWISTCQFSHSAHDDPIVFPEQPGASHFHDFVAARTTDAFSTPDPLRAGGTTCPMAGDTSAYWSPAAYEDGLQLSFGTLKHTLFYYRRKAAPTGVVVRPFPDGLKLVVGNGHATSAQDNPGIASGNITFKCGPGSDPEASSPPLACSGGVMVVVFIFPNCWDGFQLDSADHFSHMAYPAGSVCPPSHPVVVPRIQGFWRYAVGVDPIELSLSSGDWWTMHTDFFNAWIPRHLQWLLDNCINANVDCGTDPVPAVNEFAPDITSDGGSPTATVSVAENQTAVTDVDATDGDGDTITYSISGGPDAVRFTIAPATGVLTFLAPPNFEAPTDDGLDNVYDVTVQASDGSLSGTQAIAVTVTDVVDGSNGSPDITSDGGGPTAALAVAENETAVTDVDATDPDAGDTLTYSISGGADMVSFVIDSQTGVLTFLNAPNFELPIDTGMNNVYDVTVLVSDGNGGSDAQAVAVTVTNENEFGPDITSDGGGPTAAVSVAENQTAVTDVDATDGDGQPLTYSISGGSDAARFTIVPSTGVLTFATAPNFESPTDVGANNIYDVTVQASDGSLADTQAIAVTVTDVPEGPAILYFSVTTAQTLSGIPVTPQDIVAFDGFNHSLYVDGSDVGLDVSADSIDAFSLLVDGRVLVSTTGNPTVPGVSGARDEDVFVLSSGQRGATTTGTWSLYFDGSVAGLEASGEDTDAIELLDDGRILLSTSGAVNVTGVTGEDKDVLAFTPGAPGTWALYFDGSDVGLTTSAEDVDGVAFENGNLYLSTTGNFGVTGLAGADEDVFACTSVTTGPTTSCASFSLFFDGSSFGLAGNDLFAIDLP